ncbi:DNA polymerase I [Candidatus Peregrinibacteria bacterium CG1_02_41_10]|nr:MAG: DNA polymerase I [Candidatus Peregrinibacteria bacterium CG1_02_41_10]
MLSVKNIAFDSMLAAYLLDPTFRRHNLNEIALRYLGRPMRGDYLALTNGGKLNFAEVDQLQACAYSCEDAETVLELYTVLIRELKAKELWTVFNEIEMPLLPVLQKMEMAGVKVDCEKLKRISVTVEEQLTVLEKQIYTVAGEHFNISSPAQLRALLFEKLKLEPARKGKTGYSTDEAVLQQLAEKHPLPALILEYRGLLKLKNTYLEALPQLVNPETGRVHTSFNQTITATGRLSSSNPNLQNIPIRTELGGKLREAFIVEPDNLLISADYSQVELRIFAHFSRDETYLEAFAQGEDVHTATAEKIFGVAKTAVTHEMRRQAKVINFGVIYGMSFFGLASQLKISRAEAKRYLEEYFKKYAGVQKFIEELVERAKEKGYVETLFGRKRFLPDLKSANQYIFESARREAINAPIQGTAADIIKIAMINLDRRLAREKLKSRMILQIHDELLFECPESEAPRMKTIIKEEMEGVVALKAPLRVEIGIGKNWAEAH